MLQKNASKKSKRRSVLFNRRETEDEFEKLFERTMFYEQCRKCSHCRRAELVDFEVDRKTFYTTDMDVKNWKIRWQERIKRLVISPMF